MHGHGIPNVIAFREGNCNNLKTEVAGKVQDIVNTHKAKVEYNVTFILPTYYS